LVYDVKNIRFFYKIKKKDMVLFEATEKVYIS